MLPGKRAIDIDGGASCRRIAAMTLLRFPAGKNEYAHTGSDGEHADRGRDDYALPPFSSELNRLRIDNLFSLAVYDERRS